MLAWLSYLVVLFYLQLAIALPIPQKRSSSNGNPKIVVAHLMVGNVYPYGPSDWTNDFNLAKSAGIDGFALNVGTDSWQPDRVADAYKAAEATGFKLFFSFDMTVLPCSSASDANTLVNYVNQYASSPAQLLFNGRPVASTFAGEDCTFGQGNAVNGWKNQFVNRFGNTKPFFVPSFFIDPATFDQYDDVIDGMFNWNSAWSISTTTNSLASVLGSVGSSLTSVVNALPGSKPQAVIQEILNSTASDQQYVDALQPMGKKYMGSVSPWFFTHYGADSFNKNWIYLSDYLFPQRWQAIVDNRDMFDMMEVITWNDFGESHYVGPIEGAQPNSQAWVDGNEHTGWLSLIKYYAQAYKTGETPEITEDEVVIWGRTHPVNALALDDPVGKPDNFGMAQDSMFAVVLATEPSTVTLSCGVNIKTFQVPAGVSQLNVPLFPGAGMRATLKRNGKTVVDVHPTDFFFNPVPKTYNYNAFVASGSSGSSSDDN